jgi:hypothetical protein
MRKHCRLRVPRVPRERPDVSSGVGRVGIPFDPLTSFECSEGPKQWIYEGVREVPCFHPLRVLGELLASHGLRPEISGA